MGERKEQWERKKREMEFKKRRRQQAHDARNRIKASTQTWEEMKKKAKERK